jgi:hypothetical protein
MGIKRGLRLREKGSEVKVFGPKKKEVREEYKILYNKELHTLYALRNIKMLTK